MKKILAFTGSNSTLSVNRQLLRYAAGLLREQDITTIDLRDYPLPIYGIEAEKKGIPENARRLLELIETHDAYVIAVPEHNWSMTAFFKNTMDWISRARPDKKFRVLAGKPVLLLSASPSPGGGRTALAHAEALITILSGKVAGKYSLGRFPQYMDTSGEWPILINFEEEEKLKAAIQGFENTFSEAV
jgi:NAD(P)H-dependent FMN reductase